MDDILIYSKSMKEHKNLLKQVFDILRSHKIYAQVSKCEFFKTFVAFLDHMILDKGILVDPKKVKSISEWNVPRDKTEVRSFLGFASYYRRFVKGFFKIVTLLTTLLKGESES